MTDRTQISRDTSPWDSMQGRLDEAHHGSQCQGKTGTSHIAVVKLHQGLSLL